jgi:hypothetical protein
MVGRNTANGSQMILLHPAAKNRWRWRGHLYERKIFRPYEKHELPPHRNAGNTSLAKSCSISECRSSDG